MKKSIKFILLIIVIIGIACTMLYKTYATSTKENTVAKENTVVTTSQTENMVNTSENSKEVASNESNSDSGKGLGLVAAALSTGLACIGAGIAVAIVASAAVGAISENPGLLGKTIIFVGLAEGIAIYGLIISIMILNQI